MQKFFVVYRGAFVDSNTIILPSVEAVDAASTEKPRGFFSGPFPTEREAKAACAAESARVQSQWGPSVNYW